MTQGDLSRLGRNYIEEGIERTKSKAVTADMFISSVRKYTRAKKLTPRMLDELVQYIEVHQAEKVNGAWVQRLTIHYNCVGAITIPGALPLPRPDITVNTRKGVYVSYQPDTQAGWQYDTEKLNHWPVRYSPLNPKRRVILQHISNAIRPLAMQ